MKRALVYGLAITGEAVAAGLMTHGYDVVIADDQPTPVRIAAADRLGTELIGAPEVDEIVRLMESCDLVCPAPGVPENHDVIRAAVAVGVPVVTELDLAYEWEAERPGGPRPMLAVTGTDGKTTTTMLVAAMVRAGGRRAAEVGNTDVPLVAALDTDAEVFVVECSSFRLNWLRSFRAESSVWLNLAPDHQNWHSSMAAYESSKSRLWAHLRPTDTAVGNIDDEVVMRHLARVHARRRTFGGADADYRREGDALIGPAGEITTTDQMARALPHDVANALAAAAVVLEAGLADTAAVRRALASFDHPPHRIELVGEAGDVRWFNDSKATTPHAALDRDPRLRPHRPARRWPQQGSRSGQPGHRARAGGRCRRPRRGRDGDRRVVRPVLPGARRLVDGPGRRPGRGDGRARRRRTAVARLRQLRLVPPRRVPRPR